MLAPRMSSVNVKGLRQTEERYSVLFTPVATLPISMKISSGNFTKCVPWSEIPGPNLTFGSVFDLVLSMVWVTCFSQSHTVSRTFCGLCLKLNFSVMFQP